MLLCHKVSFSLRDGGRSDRNIPLSSEFDRTAWHSWWTPPSLKCCWSAAPAPHNSIRHTPGRDSGDSYRFLPSLFPNASPFQSRYHKISADGRLLHSIEGALLRGAGIEVEYGLHQCLAGFRVPVSHHEELLVWVVILRFLGAWRIINIWYHHGGVKSFRVAGVGNVIRVWGGLRMDKMSKLND